MEGFSGWLGFMKPPSTGDTYTARLVGGLLNGQERPVVSEGSLNPVLELTVKGETVRYVSAGIGHDSNGKQSWQYVAEV